MSESHRAIAERNFADYLILHIDFTDEKLRLRVFLNIIAIQQ